METRFIIRKRISDYANCPAAHLVDCVTRGNNPKSGIACNGQVFYNLEDANKELEAIAMREADQDPNYTFNFHSWPLFCASCTRNSNHEAGTRQDGTRYYYDGDVTRYEVEEVHLDEDGTYWDEYEEREIKELSL